MKHRNLTIFIILILLLTWGSSLVSATVNCDVDPDSSCPGYCDDHPFDSDCFHDNECNSAADCPSKLCVNHVCKDECPGSIVGGKCCYRSNEDGSVNPSGKCTACSGDTDPCDSCADLLKDYGQAAVDKCNGLNGDAEATCYSSCLKQGGGSDCSTRCDSSKLGDCSDYAHGGDTDKCGICYECRASAQECCESCGDTCDNKELCPKPAACTIFTGTGIEPDCGTKSIIPPKPSGSCSYTLSECSWKLVPSSGSTSGPTSCTCGSPYIAYSTSDRCGGTITITACPPTFSAPAAPICNGACETVGGSLTGNSCDGYNDNRHCVSTRTSGTGIDERPCSCGYTTSTHTSGCTTTTDYTCKSAASTVVANGVYPSNCASNEDYSTSTASGSTSCAPKVNGICTYNPNLDPDVICDDADPLNDPDDDNDGVSDCIESNACLGTSQTDSDGNGLNDNTEVNAAGCACSQLIIGSISCTDDGCGDGSSEKPVARNYYDFPDFVVDTCQNGIITNATQADCTQTVYGNDPRCDPCMETYGVADGDLYQTLTCPAPYCDENPVYDGSKASIGNLIATNNCFSTCNVIGGVPTITDQRYEYVKEYDYYDWDTCTGCTQPTCDDGACGFRDADNDGVCDDYDSCLALGVGNNILSTRNVDVDLNGYNQNTEVIAESCTNFNGVTDCPTYERLDGLTQDIIGCSCDDINLYQENCVADRCESTDYCANPISASTLLDYPAQVSDVCYTDWTSGSPILSIVKLGTCEDNVVKIPNSAACDPCQDADPLNDPDCDNDGISDCFDACLGTPALAVVNNNSSNTYYGCSCNEISTRIGGFGSIICQADGCVGADYYNYSATIATTCSDGVIDFAVPADCLSSATVTANSPACDLCNDADPLNDPDVDGDGKTDCGQDICESTPIVDTDGDGIIQINEISNFGSYVGCSCDEIDSLGGIKTYTCEDECIGTTLVQYGNYSDYCENGIYAVSSRTCADVIIGTIPNDPSCCALVDSDGDGVNDCNDLCDSTAVGDIGAVNADGCACSDLTWNNISCTGTDGCADADQTLYPDATRLWYNYPTEIVATCINGNISLSGTCDPTIDFGIECSSATTHDYDNYLSFDCQSTLECPFGYRCDNDQCVIDGVDRDGDGYYTTPFLYESGGITNIQDVDCNDNNFFINPGKTEIYYNGYDDDCNLATPDADADGDGYLAQLVVDPYFTGDFSDYDCDDSDPTRALDCSNTLKGICEIDN